LQQGGFWEDKNVLLNLNYKMQEN